MATYLQGVTDYIPQFQPFQPDLNLYANILQTKQTQYDSNWKQLNQVYGQYFYSDLTRDNNIERKEELLKNIDFNLKRVSGLDLSLQQNVEQATQVFKPFYEDQNLMKDMAWTKNYKNQRSQGMAFKNARDEDRRSMYWEDGLTALDYKREEFKDASDQAALSFGNVSYTPYVNVNKKAQQIAKDAGLSIETVEFSKDGRYIIKKKNGEALMEPLSKLFEAQLGADPGIQEVYKTQAYVNRKNYAASNAAQFNGDKNAAEMKYLENNYTMLKAEKERRYKRLEQESTSYDAKIADAEARIAKGNKSQDLANYLENLKEARDINNSVLDRVRSDHEALSEKQGTATTSTGFENPYGDMESLRWKVDSAIASSLMEKDLNEAAQIFAFKDAKTDIEADVYAVNEQKHQFSMQEIAQRNAGLERAARIRNAGERQNMIDKARLDSGAYYFDDELGKVVPNEAYNNTFLDTENVQNVTGEINMKDLSRTISQQQTGKYATPYMQQSMALLQNLKAKNLISDEQVSWILQYNGKKDVSWDKFNSKLQANSHNFLRNEVGEKDLAAISRRMDYWVRTHNQASEIANGIPGYAQASSQFKEYTSYLKADQDWRAETSKMVEQKLEASGKKYAKYLYREDGTLRSEEEFYKVINQQRPSTKVTGWDVAKNLLWDDGDPRNRVSLWSPFKAIYNPEGVMMDVAHDVGLLKDKKMKAGIYDDLLKAAATEYSSSTTIKKAPPGISAVGEMSGAGVFTPGRQSVFVSPKAMNSKGNIYFHEFTRDFRKMDFGDSKANQISFTGGKFTSDMEPEDRRAMNRNGKAIMDLMIMEMNNHKSKFTNFKMSSQAIAGNDVRKGAMIFRPDPEWLKTYVSSAGEDKPQNNLLTQQEYIAIMQNGISVISNSNNFQNGLFTSAYKDPITSVVDYYGSYSETDPYGNVTWTATKNNTGTGDYNLQTNYYLIDPETGERVSQVRYSNMLNSGQNLGQQKNAILGQDGLSEKVQLYNNGSF